MALRDTYERLAGALGWPSADDLGRIIREQRRPGDLPLPKVRRRRRLAPHSPSPTSSSPLPEPIGAEEAGTWFGFKPWTVAAAVAVLLLDVVLVAALSLR